MCDPRVPVRELYLLSLAPTSHPFSAQKIEPIDRHQPRQQAFRAPMIPASRKVCHENLLV
jgi:hypothetical protein